MNKAAEFYLGINQAIKTKIDSIMPFRATASALVDGKVQIQQIGADAPLDEPFAKLAGADVEAGDEVAVIIMNGKPFVLGRIVRDAAGDTGGSDGNFDGPVLIEVTNNNALTVQTALGTRALAVDTDGTKQIAVLNGTFLTGYDDDGTSSNWALDSVTGNARFDGNVTIGGSISMTALPPRDMYTTSDIQQTPITASTTSVSTWVDQNTHSIVLPTGTWEVNAFAFARLAHSASGSVSSRINIGATTGVNFTANASSTTQVFGPTTLAGGMSGTLTATVQAMQNAAGTLSLGASTLFVVARRTA